MAMRRGGATRTEPIAAFRRAWQLDTLGEVLCVEMRVEDRVHKVGKGRPCLLPPARRLLCKRTDPPGVDGCHQPG